MSYGLSITVSNGVGTPVELESSTNQTAVISISPGERGWNLGEATSPFMDGSVIYAGNLDRVTATLQIRCYGTAGEILDTMETLETLFSQLSYTVTVVIDDNTSVWQCSFANSTRGQNGTLDAETLGFWQDLVVSIPRQPDIYT